MICHKVNLNILIIPMGLSCIIFASVQHQRRVKKKLPAPSFIHELHIIIKRCFSMNADREEEEIRALRLRCLFELVPISQSVSQRQRERERELVCNKSHSFANNLQLQFRLSAEQVPQSLLFPPLQALPFPAQSTATATGQSFNQIVIDSRLTFGQWMGWTVIGSVRRRRTILLK